VNHLAAELLKSRAKIDILHVPYKSATTALTGLIAGEIDVVIVAASSAASYVKEGRLRALAVLDSKRSSAMPEVPTAAEPGPRSCSGDGFASRACDRGGESRLGLPAHAQARARGRGRAEAGARERKAIHAGADRRRLQSTRLVSRRASADAGDRRNRQKAGPR